MPPFLDSLPAGSPAERAAESTRDSASLLLPVGSATIGCNKPSGTSSTGNICFIAFLQSPHAEHGCPTDCGEDHWTKGNNKPRRLSELGLGLATCVPAPIQATVQTVPSPLILFSTCFNPSRS